MINLLLSAFIIYVIIGIIVEIVRDTTGGTRRAVIALLKQAVAWPFLFKPKE